MTRAIVIGGSIAGMCSARALREFYDEVVILDRDHYPERIEHRAGVPQSRHAHALLVRGQRELEQLFPGFVARMCARGALLFDAGQELAFRRLPGWQQTGMTGVQTLWCSRILLEHTVRSLLIEGGGVVLRQGCHVTELCGDSRRVTGVRYREGGGGVHELAAELVVDASGRSTHADAWLEALQVKAPVAQRVDAHLGYASRLYRAPPPQARPPHWWWRGLWVDPEPNNPRAGVIFPIENGYWMVTAVGIGEHPPTDEAGYLAFLASLSTPAIAQALVHAEPVSSVTGNRSTANVYRRYDQWTGSLRGFIAVGDAVCAFNPVYGQGMSTSAACAGILRKVLQARSVHSAFERAFWVAQAEFLRGPWDLATGADFAWGATEGERPSTPAWLAKYLQLALESTHYDIAMLRHIIPVFHLTGSALRFFEPRFMIKAITGGVLRRIRLRLLGPARKPTWPPMPPSMGPRRPVSAPPMPRPTRLPIAVN